MLKSFLKIFKTKKNIPVQSKQGVWTIGIYTGTSPFNLTPSVNCVNPVLKAEDITDAKANFVADPFMIKENSLWNMFFEVEVSQEQETIGKIGLATSSDGLKFNYKKIVLEESCHLSYPYVFKDGNKFFMIPETRALREIRLYEAVDFPTKWRFKKTILKGKRFADNSLIKYNGLWWMFTDSGNTTLRLYYAKELTDKWQEHKKSPIIKKNPKIARPGGRVIVYGNHIIRNAQDCLNSYGSQVWGFKITKLTKETYHEEKILHPIICASENGWNKYGMHTVDSYQQDDGTWIACVDGYGEIKKT